MKLALTGSFSIRIESQKFVFAMRLGPKFAFTRQSLFKESQREDGAKRGELDESMNAGLRLRHYSMIIHCTRTRVMIRCLIFNTYGS